MHSGERKGVPNQPAWTEKSVWRVMFSSILHSDECFYLLALGEQPVWIPSAKFVLFFSVLHKAFAFTMLLLGRGKWEHQISGDCVFLLCLLMELSFFSFGHLLLSSIRWVQRRTTASNIGCCSLKILAGNKRGVCFLVVVVLIGASPLPLSLGTSRSSFAKLHWI